VETKKKHKNPRKKYFTDIDNKYWFEEQNDDCKGTTLYIRSINEIWTLYDIQRAEKELSKLISPVKKLVLPFNVFISSNEHSNDYNKKEVKNNAIQFATEEIFLKFNLSEGTQDVLVNKKGTLDIEKRPILSAGPILFKFYFFDQAAKAKYKSHYKGESIDGVKIYRDGIITTPFAEYEHQDIKKRDILGIDKRRYSGFFDKISSSDLIGIVEITKEHNPRIIDATNRQDFVDNQEYRSLKEFIIEQILALEEYRKSQREEAKQKANIDLNKAKEDLKSFNSDLKSISNTRPELKQYLLPLERKVQKVIVDFNKGLKAYSELEKEKIRQENIFLSLMSLQDYALEISHVVRTSLARVIHLAEFFKTEFPNEQYNHVFEKYAVTIYNEMITLGRAVDFMLSYAGSNTDFTEINLKELIENLFLNVYHPIFEKNKIKVIVEINRPLIITHNRKFFEDIIENFISNSIKALSQAKEKIIKCTGVVELDQFTLYFSDNGSGIAEEDRRRIFDIYFTRTPELGGAGIGLFIVKKRIEALKGTVEVVDNELKPNGATFKIVLPFKR
jgi:signal transduction histidine kinase